MKIRTTKFRSLASDYYDYGGYDLTRVQAQNLKSRNFLANYTKFCTSENSPLYGTMLRFTLGSSILTFYDIHVHTSHKPIEPY